LRRFLIAFGRVVGAGPQHRAAPHAKLVQRATGADSGSRHPVENRRLRLWRPLGRPAMQGIMLGLPGGARKAGRPRRRTLDSVPGSASFGIRR
jgi:hypothetical protein